MSTFKSTGERVWFAWHCLPRNSNRQPPPVRQLEDEYGITDAGLHKLMWDKAKRPGPVQARRIAAALRVSREWLFEGVGEGPKASWPVPPRPPEPTQPRREGPVRQRLSSNPPSNPTN
jgi:hypothetical protein